MPQTERTELAAWLFPDSLVQFLVAQFAGANSQNISRNNIPITLVYCPPKSPDLIPIEHLLDMLKS